MRNIFKYLCIAGLFAFVACDNKSCSGIDVSLLEDPEALYKQDALKAESLNFFAEAIGNTVSKNREPSYYTGDFNQRNLLHGQEIKDHLAAHGKPQAAINNVINSLEGFQLIDQNSSHDELSAALEGLNASFFKFSSVKKDLLPEISDKFKSFKTDYLKDLCAIASSSAKKELQDFIAAHKEKAEEIAVLLENDPDNKDVQNFKDAFDSVISLEDVDYVDPKVLTSAISLLELLVKFYDELEDTEKNFLTLQQSANSLLGSLKRYAHSLLSCVKDKVPIVQSLYFNDELTFDTNKLSPLKIAQSIKAGDKKIIFSAINKSDSDVLASYLTLNTDQSVYFFDIAKVSSKAQSLGLSEDDYTSWIAVLIDSVSKEKASIVFITHLSNLSLGPQSSLAANVVIKQRLDKIFSKVQKSIVLVEVLQQHDFLLNESLSAQVFSNSVLDLFLSKSIVDEITDMTAKDVKEKNLEKDIILQASSVVRALLPREYSLGALYEIWQGYERDFNAGNVSSQHERKTVLTLAKSIFGINEKEITKKDLLSFTWDKIEFDVNKNAFSFTSDYKKPDLRAAAAMHEAFFQTQKHKSALEAVTKQSMSDLNTRTQEIEQNLISRGNTIVGEIDSARQSAANNINQTKEIAQTEVKVTRNEVITELDNTLDSSKNELTQAKNAAITAVANTREDIIGVINGVGKNVIDGLNQFKNEATTTINNTKDAAIGEITTAQKDGVNAITASKDGVIAQVNEAGNNSKALIDNTAVNAQKSIADDLTIKTQTLLNQLQDAAVKGHESIAANLNAANQTIIDKQTQVKTDLETKVTEINDGINELVKQNKEEIARLQTQVTAALGKENQQALAAIERLAQAEENFNQLKANVEQAQEELKNTLLQVNNAKDAATVEQGKLAGEIIKANEKLAMLGATLIKSGEDITQAKDAAQKEINDYKEKTRNDYNQILSEVTQSTTKVSDDIKNLANELNLSKNRQNIADKKANALKAKLDAMQDVLINSQNTLAKNHEKQEEIQGQIDKTIIQITKINEQIAQVNRNQETNSEIVASFTDVLNNLSAQIKNYKDEIAQAQADKENTITQLRQDMNELIQNLNSANLLKIDEVAVSVSKLTANLKQTNIKLDELDANSKKSFFEKFVGTSTTTSPTKTPSKKKSSSKKTN